jgi:hypothetical protein
MFVDDATACLAYNVSYKKNIHLRRLARQASISQRERVACASMECGLSGESTAIL